ncbi:MAG: ATP-dependent RecD-like DNA helicase, partial [Acetatifactor sp.]|nr:ATP-dependent RecD-like DNA helicase [Acetatifactor sp.]
RVPYPFALLAERELSYAITIHKSQGSEYPAVILPLLAGPKLLFNRNLLYTAITRAKSCVTILGSSDTVRGMIDNVSENSRYTGLAERIREVVGEEAV